ncbi:flavin-containing monooxygenase [Pseudohalioglobus lutimaris]|uniref:Cyclohexanone monooxygenase n=1 Tax=Pseudohalioglobus lutimaris TaxID=1737061 RepID=A0A2N5X517_9GAMM|nr:NAD(P)/FAD-dependent oxidoreductase [Pseudohalioglobus lutimaris]PLW69574.1 cyclohexanone monooxygenase [Pseudohalioglobus lutimaris]
MSSENVENVDIVIIGAGFSGMYALHRLRNHNVVCLEAGEGVGGTWYWNRYPGARVDIESVEYSYSFDEELQQEWSWPEYFSAQPDLERYANHVADRFNLRERIRFSNPVKSMRFNQDENLWHVYTAQGNHLVCRYVIAATGSLTAPNMPPWPGREAFKGDIYHTARWPAEGVDFSGKRVGFIGTGSTGIQAMPIIAEQAEELYVFQRTPAFCMPSGNRPLDEEYERDWKDNYQERRRQMLDTYGASLIKQPEFSAHECTAEQREDILEQAWKSQSAFQLILAFSDVMTDPEVNEMVCEFARNKIRSIVKDPEVAELLCPTSYPIGGKRLCIGNGYFEMYNRGNVTLVDVKKAPIIEFTETGLRTEAAQYDLDIIITATGFDAVTGAMERIDIEGCNNRKLVEKWADGPTTYLGAMVSGFPNLFMIHGPSTPAAQAQMITSGEWQVNWTADIIDNMEQEGLSRIDVTEEAEQSWAQEVNMVSEQTLHKLADSWYNAKNIEGKKGGMMIYVGGFPRFSELCEAAIADGYKGFTRE